MAIGAAVCKPIMCYKRCSNCGIRRGETLTSERGVEIKKQKVLTGKGLKIGLSSELGVPFSSQLESLGLE